MIQRIICCFCVWLLGMQAQSSIAIGQTRKSDNHQKLTFQVEVSCDGRQIPMTFCHHSGYKELVYVGVGEYGQPAIDTTTVGCVVLPDSVTDEKGRRCKVHGIRRQAFAGCSRLTGVVLPDSLSDIGDQAFYGCTNLREITLPPALKVIYPFAFRGCRHLGIIRLHGSRPAVYENIFDQSTLDNATLYVPAGTAEAYANSLVWGMFRYRFEEIE